MKYFSILFLLVMVGCADPALKQIALPEKVTFATSSTVSAQVRSSDFEVLPVNSGLQLLEGSMSYSVTRSDSVKRTGTYAARFELRRTDPEVQYGNKRAEITVINNTTSPNNAVRWYRFSTFIPSAGWETDIKEEVTPVQFHDKSSNCSASPPLAIEILGNAWRIRTRYSTADYCTNTRTERTPVAAGNIRFDQWDDWIIEYRPRADNSGFIRIYRNDSLIFSLENAYTNYVGSQIPYMKIGVYKWVWNQTNYGGSVATKRILFLDALAVYDSSAVYNDVDITPTGANQPPTVSAGSYQEVNNNVTTGTLTGTASDADGTISTYLWEQTAGPNTASITSSGSASTGISGLIPGLYSFKLTVTDNGGATAFSTVDFRVNRLPVVDMSGNTTTINVSASSFTITSSATDADGTITARLWEQTGGPATTINATTSATSTVTGPFTVGSYTYRMRATDNTGDYGYGSVTINIVSSPGNGKVKRGRIKHQ